MKHLFFLLTITVIFFSACNSNEAHEHSHNQSEVESVIKTFEVIDFMAIAEDSLEKEIKITGMVSHVCSHSGRRCFLEDSTGEHSIKVEAKGEIKGFNRELVGENLLITGIVKERRLTAEFIDEWETKVKENNKHEDVEEGGKHCVAEMQNIKKMRDWMKEYGKDYYSIFYMDGMDYEIIEEK